MHWTASAGSMTPRGSAGVVKLLPVTATVACAGWQQHHALLAPCPALWLFSLMCFYPSLSRPVSWARTALLLQQHRLISAPTRKIQSIGGQ